jgi:hypothetical protein
MSPAERAARRHRATSWILLALLLVFTAAVIVPPMVNISRYKHRIAESVSRSLERPVRISAVKLRLLPRPGFELSDVTINEDPAFGAEPLLRAASVTAAIRLSSLWRGRLEIARISLDEPSINLVRNGEGRWNLSPILLQASRVSSAPTGQRHSGGTPRFPYIEASSARINFKSGDEKRPFSLLTTDFSIWLENPDEWRLRLEGQPVRTDLSLDLSDTGLVRMEGSLRRAGSLGRMPVNIDVEWSNVQVGQMVRLLMGDDTGWRGDLRVRANIQGTIDHAQLKGRLRVNNIHRIEFAPLQPVNLDTDCKATYERVTESLSGLACLSPIGDGQLLVTGDVRTLTHPAPALAADFQHVPASLLLDMLRVVRNGFAPSTQAGGTLDAHLTYSADPGTGLPAIQGQGTVTALSISGPGFDKPLQVPAFHFASLAAPQAPVSPHRRKPASVPASAPVAPLSGLTLDPASIAMGAPVPLVVRGSLSPTGYSLQLTGQAAVASLISFSQNFGLLRGQLAPLAPHGTAELDLSIRGPWLLPIAVFGQAAVPSPATTQGTFRLRNAVLNTNLLTQPIELVSAQALLADGQASWTAVSANYGKLHAEGSFTYPFACPANTPCPRRFDLHTSELDLGQVEAALTGNHGELVQAILSRIDHHVPWPLLTGTLHAGTVSLGTFAVHDAAASLEISGNTLKVQSLDGRALGGALHLSGALDSSADTPRYTVDAECTHADPAELARVFHEKWGSGNATLSARLALAGFTPGQLADSARGTFAWDWQHGSLAAADAASGPGTPLSHFEHWHAEGTIASKTLRLERGDLRTAAGILPLRGTISFSRQLSLTSSGEARPLAIRGTLEHSHIESEEASRADNGN